jgi:hypothetical protein
MELRLMAFAAASGRVAIVFFIGKKLMDWRISDSASKNPDQAITWIERQIGVLKPDVIVTENTALAHRKGDTARSITEAVSQVAEKLRLLNPRVRRHHDYINKYEEADAIAELYPELKSWLPRWRRFFENEPRNTVLFEAMSYALSILRDPSRHLSAAMG